jgi:predicted O-linked N-acetylglucosamine transferase (SPINDLY family)
MSRFRKSIPDVAARIRFLPRLGQEDYFHLLALSDALLDPIHFTGGNSSFEGFAVGTPIVTLPSPFMRGRMTYALYRKMGILDCIAETPGEYAEIALRLGTDLPWRESIKKRILASGHLLFEDLSAVRELEDFLTGAVARARAKKSPGPA